MHKSCKTIRTNVTLKMFNTFKLFYNNLIKLNNLVLQYIMNGRSSLSLFYKRINFFFFLIWYKWYAVFKVMDLMVQKLVRSVCVYIGKQTKNVFTRDIISRWSAFCDRTVIIVYNSCVYISPFFSLLQTKADLVKEYENKLQNVEFGLVSSAKTDFK